MNIQKTHRLIIQFFSILHLIVIILSSFLIIIVIINNNIQLYFHISAIHSLDFLPSSKKISRNSYNSFSNGSLNDEDKYTNRIKFYVYRKTVRNWEWKWTRHKKRTKKNMATWFEVSGICSLLIAQICASNKKLKGKKYLHSTLFRIYKPVCDLIHLHIITVLNTKCLPLAMT